MNGGRNLLSRALGGTTFTVGDVPSGTYHVRVRAINEVGRSRPSADLRIVIP
jgi:predicted phage tail protein